MDQFAFSETIAISSARDLACTYTPLMHVLMGYLVAGAGAPLRNNVYVAPSHMTLTGPSSLGFSDAVPLTGSRPLCRLSLAYAGPAALSVLTLRFIALTSRTR